MDPEAAGLVKAKVSVAAVEPGAARAEDPVVEELATNEQELVLRARAGDIRSFSALVEKYQESLMRAAWRVVRGREEAEDIVQESFVKIYKNAHKFQKYEGIEFKSWAYKVTINTAITHYRKLKRGEFLSEDPSIYQEAGNELADNRIFSKTDAHTAVADTIAQMPDHLRSVLERYYMEDKSYRTIADEEGISISTLKMRLFRAKKMFKKLGGNL